MSAVQVRWEASNDEHMKSLKQAGLATALPELGHAVHVEVEGLKPGYEYAPTNGKCSRVRTHAGTETFTVQDYRNRHAQYKLAPDLQAAHAPAPLVVT